ncbi:MAG: tetratricopeptide repeat-containing sensor histidine kinase [Flavobacteriales bacterium]|nr:tetratricopeptide repeat-containing sensor histidine kinase [Flavobacteriales bacterium]
MNKIKGVKKISGEKDDIEKLNQIINLCRDNYNIAHDKTYSLAKSGIEICEKLSLSAEKNILETYLAFFLWHNNEPQKALSIIYSISEKLLANKNYLEFSLGVIITSLIEWAKGEVELAFNTINQAFEELKNKENTKVAIIRLNWNLGVFYFDLDEIEDSLRHYQLSKNSLDHETDFSVVAYINIGLATVYKKKLELEKAEKLFEEILVYSQTNNIWMVEARSYHELGMLEQLKENFDKAYSLFSKSYEIRLANNARPAIVTSLISMAQIDIVKKNFSNAEIKLLQALEISKEKNLKPKTSILMLQLSGIKEEQFKHKESLFYLKKHYELEKELKNVVKNNKNAYLQLTYKVQKTAKELEREKELSLLKTSFVSTASHQFRTPLAVIQSNTELLLMLLSKIDNHELERVKKVTGRITGQIAKMTELMDEVLILGKLTSGNVHYEAKELNLVEFCNILIQQFNAIQEDGRILEFKIIGETYRVKLDSKLLGHTLTNLISNAFKYSVGKENPELSIHFKAKEVILSVKDYGIGISKNEQLHLFEPFYRADNATDIKGTGLGLSIAKEYVEINRGNILVKSILGEGSCFEIIFKR